MARNKYPEETRNLIIDTAMRLFIENGYDHTSIQMIIDHLGGLSKGAIYHHFKSKDEIITAVADKMYSGSVKLMREVCEQTDLTGKEKMRALFRLSVFNPAQEDMFGAAPDMLKNPQFLVLYLQDSVMTEAPELMQKVLEEGMQDGSIHTEYPKELSEVLMLVGNIWLNPMIYHCGSFEMVRKVKFYRHMLNLFGLDVIEDEVVDKLEQYTEIYNNKKKK